MVDRRSAYDRCVADLEMARIVLNNLTSAKGVSGGELQRAAIHAKKLEIKLAAAKLAQADYHLNSLRARVDFLEALSVKDAATKREIAELAWAREAVPVNSATVARLAAELEQRKQELDDMLSNTSFEKSL